MEEKEKKRKVRKDYKYKFTKEQLRKEIHNALMWTSNGLEFHVSGKPETSQALVMGDVENLTVILTLALTEGLPEEDSSASSASSPAV